MRYALVFPILFSALIAFGAGSVLAEDAEPAKKPSPPWKAVGRVTDADGKPMADVDVWAHCGNGSLRRTGSCKTNEEGRYELEFGPGIWFRGQGASIQYALISAHKPGFYDETLNRAGDFSAAIGTPTPADLKEWGASEDRLFKQGESREINFVMIPAGAVASALVDEQGRPLADYSVSVVGADMAPGCSVMGDTKTDAEGRFRLEGLPSNYRYQLEVRQSNHKPPWDDSWASAALMFEQPETGDLKARFGDREIQVDHLVIQVRGEGANAHRRAVPIAGNTGILHLTASNPADVTENSKTRLVAKEAMLILSNEKQDVSQSLVPESVPSEPTTKSKTHLSRSRPNDAGEFVISFTNPPGTQLEEGKHQVIFQVAVGSPESPTYDRIFKQIEISDTGKYAVPVKVDPTLIDESRVSLTFLTIQPKHEEFIKAFFERGSAGYSGLWKEDGGLMPAIPFTKE